jgi:hypothetical protein
MHGSSVVFKLLQCGQGGLLLIPRKVSSQLLGVFLSGIFAENL